MSITVQSVSLWKQHSYFLFVFDVLFELYLALKFNTSVLG